MYFGGRPEEITFENQWFWRGNCFDLGGGSKGNVIFNAAGRPANCVEWWSDFETVINCATGAKYGPITGSIVPYEKSQIFLEKIPGNGTDDPGPSKSEPKGNDPP
jgi:hypothetical protein